MTPEQETLESVKTPVPYERWHAEVEKFEREVHRLSWRTVCELRAGMPLDKVVKTADAANRAHEALMDYLADHKADHSTPPAAVAGQEVS